MDPLLSTTAEQRRKRRLEIDAALAALASKLKRQNDTLPLWPAALFMTDMCSRKDSLTGSYVLEVTYQILSELGTPMSGSPQLRNFVIAESFPYQDGNLANLNAQAGTWSLVGGSISLNGRMTDILSSMSFAISPASGNALQVFTATGWFGVQPLDIIFGTASMSGVNANSYSRTSVTVNGMGASRSCP